jgi:hypothetical protein
MSDSKSLAHFEKLTGQVLLGQAEEGRINTGPLFNIFMRQNRFLVSLGKENISLGFFSGAS